MKLYMKEETLQPIAQSIRYYYEKRYATKLDNLEEMDKFLKRHYQSSHTKK